MLNSCSAKIIKILIFKTQIQSKSTFVIIWRKNFEIYIRQIYLAKNYARLLSSNLNRLSFRFFLAFFIFWPFCAGGGGLVVSAGWSALFE